MRPPSGRPIAVGIVALVVAAVLASTIVLFAVTYSGPPPMQRPVAIDDLARQLAGRALPPRDRRRPPERRERGWFGRIFGEDRTRTIVTSMQAAPAPAAGSARLVTIERQLAAAIPTTSDRVHVFSDRQPPFMERDVTGEFVAAWRTDSGWRVVRPAPRPVLTAWHRATLAAMALALIALALPAWAIARALSRPLRQVARAAAQAQAGTARPDFPDGGPREVRALTAAVSAMHDRLARHAASRTAMLGAIAHDLGTPLSRLAFWIELLPPAQRDRAAADIDEMRAMIGDTLAFARDEAMERSDERVELSSLIDSLAEDLRVGGADVSVAGNARAIVLGEARALRRLFANLVGNAIRYGEAACIDWQVADGAIHVTVRDRGPGIGTQDAERLFEPFVRGEASRNRATGGTGLGLAIVRSIAARHGGRVTLANDPAGGAVATVTLPIAD